MAELYSAYLMILSRRDLNKAAILMLYISVFAVLSIFFAYKVEKEELRYAQELISGKYDKEYPNTEKGRLNLIIDKQRASIVLESKAVEKGIISYKSYRVIKNLRKDEIKELKMVGNKKITAEEYTKNSEERNEILKSILEGDKL